MHRRPERVRSAAEAELGLGWVEVFFLLRGAGRVGDALTSTGRALTSSFARFRMMRQQLISQTQVADAGYNEKQNLYSLP